MKKLLITSFFCMFLYSPLFSEDFSHFAGREWDFMEEIFVKRVNAEVRSGTRLMRFLITATASSVGFFSLIKEEPVVLQSDEFSSWMKSARGTFLTHTALLVGVSCAEGYRRLRYDAYAYNMGMKFLEKWPLNKKYTPTSLHAQFDRLYESLLNKNKLNKRFKKVLTDLVVQIRQTIFNYNPNKYYKNFEYLMYFNDKKYFNDDLLPMF